MKEMYEGGLYAEKNPTWHEEDAPWKAGHVERMIKRNKIPCDSICEIGCGTGELLLTLQWAFPSAKFFLAMKSLHKRSAVQRRRRPRVRNFI